MGSPNTDAAERWRKEAEEARTIAENMRDPQAKRTMHGIAETLEALAQNAAAQARQKKS